MLLSVLAALQDSCHHVSSLLSLPTVPDSASSSNSKDGHLFDKEAILQYIITKKNEYSRKLKEFEKQRKEEEAEKEEDAASEQKKLLEKFIKTETKIVSESVLDAPSTSTAAKATTSSSISNMVNGRDKQLPSFWLPSQAPTAKASKLAKPDSTIYCPVSGKPIKAKDLIDVKFTPVQDPDDKKSLITKESRYMCPITHDILSNSVPCAVLRPT